MSKKIIGVTVGTPTSVAKIRRDLEPQITTDLLLAHEVSAVEVYVGEDDQVSIGNEGIHINNTNSGIFLNNGAKLRIDGKDVMGDMETALDNIIAIQEELIGTITFYFEDSDINLQATCTALNRMTWAEWCNSKYNPNYAYIDEDGYVCTVSNDEYVARSGEVTVERADWIIISGTFYGFYENV